MAKLAFLWHFDKAEQIYPYWRDGLKKALEIIGENHDVEYYFGDDFKNLDEQYDAFLFWTDSQDNVIDFFQGRKGKKGIILTTSPTDIENLKKYDVVFCESKPVYNEARSLGLHTVHAFGTDTDFFSPDETIKKDIPYFYPATFSPWKRQASIASLGDKLWCVGTVQPDGLEELYACKDKGVHIAEGYFKAEYIRDLYRRAEQVIIPAIHGSERTILEAMSMDLFPTVNPQNKAFAIIKEFQQSDYDSPREFVIDRYNETQYAEKIMKGLGIK